MPPKSAKKDQPKATWYTCERCSRKITHNQLSSSHEKACEEFGILNEIFTIRKINESLPKEIDEPHSLYLQRFLFIPEAICNFCNFTMNCNVLIEVNGKFYVKQAWPIGDNHLDVIYSSSLGENKLICLITLTFILYFSRAQKRTAIDIISQHIKAQQHQR